MGLFNFFSKAKDNLPKPKSYKQEILLHLIRNGKVSFHHFNIQDFRKEISTIKNDYDIRLTSKEVESMNKYGNKYRFVEHYLPDCEKDDAIALYKKLWANTKRRDVVGFGGTYAIAE